jgi:glutamine synthetase
MAALLQGMLEGIEGEMVPPPPVEGNAYDEEGLFLPDDMDDALQLTAKSGFIDRALGPLLAKVYRDLKRAEIIAFWGEITPLERTTYL